MSTRRAVSAKSPVRTGTPARSGKKKKRTTKSASPLRRAEVAHVTCLERSKSTLDPASMENLYYIAHTAVDALELRGFGPKRKSKKKKGKKKRKKKN